MNGLLLPALLIAAIASHPQTDDEPKQPAKTRAYHAYRLVETPPSYGLRKVRALVAKITPKNDDDSLKLTDKQFNALTTKEKFTYCMLHAEDLDQNCAEMPVIAGEEGKIFAYAPGPFYDNYTWSPRQEKFLKANRTLVISLIRTTIKLRHRVGLNLKKAIVELEAKQLVQDMLAVYKNGRKDKDILTVCCNLMKDAKYKTFLASPTYKTLYGDEAASYKSYVTATPAHEKQIIGWASKFTKG